MMRALLFGSALALSVGFAVQAQEPASQPANPPASDAGASMSKLKAGMVVKDSAGATIGKIADVGSASDASATVAVDVDGKKVKVPASTLSLNAKGDAAVSSQTKAEIKAAKADPS